MKELSKQEADLIKKKIDVLFLSGDLHELNEINSMLGLEHIDENLNINNHEDNGKIEQAVRNMLTSFGEGIKDFDKEEILDFTTNLDNSYIKDFLQNMSDDIKLSVLPKFGMFDEEYIIDVINSMQSDEKKLEALSLTKNDLVITYVAETIHSDENKLKIMDLTDSDDTRAIIAGLIQSDELKLKGLEKIKDENSRTKVIRGIQNDKLKKELMEKIQNASNKSAIMETMQNDESKLEQLQMLTSESAKFKVIKTMQDDSYKTKALEFISEQWYKAQIIMTMQSDELKIELINTIENDFYKANIIASMQSDELKIELIDTIENDFYKANIIVSMQNDAQKLDLLKGLKEENTRDSVIVTLDSDESKLEALKMYTDESYMLYTANKLTFQDDKIKLEVMTLVNDPLLSTKLRSTMQKETVSENLVLIMKCEGITEGIEEKVNLLKQMEERNDSLYNTIDFRMLDENIVSAFKQEQLEQLVCYPNIESKIIALINNQESWKMFQKMFVTISQDTQSWDVKTNRVLEQLNLNTYQELIYNIGEQDIDIGKLVKIMQMPNYFELKTQEDLKNFSDIKRKVCDSIINGEFKSKDSKEFELISKMSEIDQVRFAVLQKLYGQDLETAKTIIKKYGNDIDSLDQNSDEVVFVKALQEIMKTDDIELLKRYYSIERGIEEELIDSITIENQLKHDYGKMFNNGLLQADGLEPGEVEGTLKAGTDFRLIITSVAPFIKNTPENFEQDWNRKAIASRGFCCSYLTSDMIGTAPIPHLCYGFSEMSDDALMLSGPTDIYSNAIGLEATAKHDERYYSPENQISNTIYRGVGTYNEMVFKRQQNGEKKQPSYIVVFKENGKVPNMEVAQKARQQWQEAGRYLPIVIVDKNECAKANKEQISEALSQCNTLEDFKKVKQRLENNRKWNRYDFEELVPRMEELEIVFQLKAQSADEKQKAEEFFENCYQSTDAKDREEATGAIKRIYREMQESRKILKTKEER